RFRYNCNFVRFAASVVWRALVLLRTEGRLAELAQLSDQVDAAERSWRSYLLEDCSSPTPHDLHVFEMDAPPPDPALRDLPAYLSRHVLRTVGVVTVQRDDFGYLFVKLARMNVFGTVQSGSQRRKWRNSKLHTPGGWWGGEPVTVPIWVPSLFVDGATLEEAT